MDQIIRQVAIAKRRLARQRFVVALTWSLLVSFAIAGIGLAIFKFWPPAMDATSWALSWLASAPVIGLLAAIIWLWRTRGRSIEAAIEIDRRWGLKERVSSSLALKDHELVTPAGQALVADTTRRLRGVDVASKFGWDLGWFNLSPAVPLLLALVVAFLIPGAAPSELAQASAAVASQSKPVQKAGEGLKKRFADRSDEAEEAGLEDAEQLFTELQRSAERMASLKDSDRRQGLVELNNMASELERRRAEIGGREAIRERLRQSLNPSQAPADRLARALQNGAFDQAKAELQKLRDQMAKAQLSDTQREAMSERMDRLADQLQKMAEKQASVAQQMQAEIDRMTQQGNVAQAGSLQNQLDRLNAESPQLQRLSKMAEQLGECSKCMKNGQGAQAAEAIDGLMAQLDALEMEMQEMAMLDQALDAIADAKSGMNCQSCQGAGCSQCQGLGMGQKPGQGLGRGQGVGQRPEDAGDTESYDSLVRGKPGPGKAVVVGTMGGPNLAGNAREQIRAAVESAHSDSADPLTGQRLPRAHREAVQQYFDAARTAN